MSDVTLVPTVTRRGFDWSGSFNGLTWGKDASVPLHAYDIEGIFKPPPLRQADVPRVGADGSFYGRDTYDERVITASLTLAASDEDEFEAKKNEITSAMVLLRNQTMPLLLNGGSALLNVRPVDFNVPRAYGRSGRFSTVTLQWRAADPLIYSAEVISGPVAMAPGEGGPGWTFPWTFPWLFQPPGTTSPSNLLIYNSGNIDSPPLFRISGPMDRGFELRNVTTNRFLQVLLDLNAGDWVDVDMGLGAVLFGSTADRRDAVVPGTDFWTLVPGDNTVRLEQLGAASAGGAQIFYRSAYIAL